MIEITKTYISDLLHFYENIKQASYHHQCYKTRRLSLFLMLVYYFVGANFVLLSWKLHTDVYGLFVTVLNFVKTYYFWPAYLMFCAFVSCYCKCGCLEVSYVGERAGLAPGLILHKVLIGETYSVLNEQIAPVGWDYVCPF